jgi:hypothetical protein
VEGVITREYCLEKKKIGRKLFQNCVDAPQDRGGKANGAVMLDVTLIAHDQPATIGHPPEAPLDLPARAVTRPTALSHERLLKHD